MLPKLAEVIGDGDLKFSSSSESDQLSDVSDSVSHEGDFGLRCWGLNID